MPYEFDKELCQLIVEIRGIWKDLLSMQLKLFRSYPSVAAVPSIDYLVMDCILQANEIWHDLLDSRLAIMMERDLFSLIHPHNITWPGYYVHLILLWCLSCPPLLLELLNTTHSPCLLFFPHLNYEISVNLLTTWPSSRSWPPPILNCTSKSPTFKLLDWTIQHLECLVQKEQEELYEVFLVLEVERITEVLSPLIICKRTEQYKPYRVYHCWRLSPSLIPLPDSPLVHSLIPSWPPTPSLKLPLASPKSLSSYHMAPSHQPNIVHCESCNEEGHILEKCTHNYRWHPDMETYTPIPYGEKTTVPWYSGWTLVFVLEKTGKSLA